MKDVSKEDLNYVFKRSFQLLGRKWIMRWKEGMQGAQLGAQCRIQVRRKVAAWSGSLALTSDRRVGGILYSNH